MWGEKEGGISMIEGETVERKKERRKEVEVTERGRRKKVEGEEKGKWGNRGRTKAQTC